MKIDSPYFPIVSSSNDATLVAKYYPDATACRVLLHQADALKDKLPEGPGIWLDAGFDGFPKNGLIGKAMDQDPAGRTTGWYDFWKKRLAFDLLVDASFTKRDGRSRVKGNERGRLQEAVFQVLDECHEHRPRYLTVPQLAQGEGKTRKCVNRALAELTAEWVKDRGYAGNLVFPLIFSRVSGQTEDKFWRDKVDTAINYCGRAHAHILWTVDASLDEEKARDIFREKRFPRMIEIHQRLRDGLDKVQVIAGPYWGFNILLWAKELIDAPTIAVGSSYRYYLSGGRATKATPRAAVGPLCRLAVVETRLYSWLADALDKLARNEPEFPELEKLERMKPETMTNVEEIERKEKEAEDATEESEGALASGYEQIEAAGMNAERIYAQLEDLAEKTPIREVSELWRDQVASYYREWLSSIAQAPQAGRSLRLYQQLSRAYVLGRILKGKMAARTGYAERPEAHAEQLMQFCL